LKQFFATIRRLASGLVALIGCETEKDYVLRPWTEEENADFERFCSSIGEIPSDPVTFFSNDPWYDQILPRA
jgi:hypothetical protein